MLSLVGHRTGEGVDEVQRFKQRILRLAMVAAPIAVFVAAAAPAGRWG
jgi:hypothetical protein